MRVPVYPQDLAHNRGFKSLAKKLWKQWCGPNALSLDRAQEILSKGLGYRYFYDLRQESKPWPPSAPTPNVIEIQCGILSAAKGAMSPEELVAIDHAQLKRLVMSLPLSVLTAVTSTQVLGVEPVLYKATTIGGCIATLTFPPPLPESSIPCLQCGNFRFDLNEF